MIECNFCGETKPQELKTFEVISSVEEKEKGAWFIKIKKDNSINMSSDINNSKFIIKNKNDIIVYCPKCSSKKL